MDGFAIYGFEEDNLMAKNALVDLDLWKHQAEEIMKTQAISFNSGRFSVYENERPTNYQSTT